MNIKRYLLTVVLAFAFIMGFEFLWHSLLLAPDYEASASLWRTEESMQNYCWIMFASRGLLAALIVYMFTKNYEGRGIGEGLRFGLLVGLIFGILQGSLFVYMPITEYLAGMWLAGDVLFGLGTGIVCALAYRN